MYKKLLIMQTISFIIMYSVMFLNVASLDHLYLSITRVYMALLMVTPMVPLMILMMAGMYKNKKLNRVAIGLSTLIFVLSLLGLRSQWLISDDQYMNAMIPHHSSAILTSQRANIENPEVKKLSQEIIEAQEREISLMKELLGE